MSSELHVDGSSLPFPQTPSASVVGRKLTESRHEWRQDPRRLPEDAPNIVIFMSDDAGFSNPDTFGGPVHTPTMTRLAEGGISYNRFHTTAMCSPTRASLLTGRNHTRVGAGQIAEFANDFDGYVGEIPRSAATAARVLSEYGYNTAALGKWHNTPPSDIKPGGPYDQYPTGLGFGYFYGFIAGETSQYEPRLFENVNPIEPPHDPEYHLTEDMAEKAKTFIRNHLAHTPEDPFFLYFAPGAVHGPHQIFKEWADKYEGKFDEGWEVLREETFQRQKELGWIPDDAELTPIMDGMQRWEDVPEEQRRFQTRLMELFAGFLEHTDVQYGKVVDELEAQGLLDNTIIIYINSDNGAAAEGMNGTISELLAQNSMFSTVEEQIEVLERDYGGMDALGGPLLENMYHHGWAWAGDTPFKSTKLVAAHFGGTRTPCVIHWPRRIQPDRAPRDQFHHVIDIVPTLYDIIGITPPRTVDGFEQIPLDGDSMVYTFDDPDAPEQKRPQFFDISGSRGVYQDGWFACTFGPNTPWTTDISWLPTWDPDDDVWELYDLKNDFSQANDLADELPRKLDGMKDLFTMEATRNLDFPIGGGLYVPGYHPEEMRTTSLTEWNFFPGQTRVGETLAPRFASGFSTLATIEATLPEHGEGVLFCVGGSTAGFTVFMNQGHLHAEYNAMTLNRYKVRSDGPLPPGRATIEVETRFDARERESAGTITFRLNGDPIGSGRFERSVPVAFTASETFDIGTDLGSPVSLDYYDRAPFSFNGQIHQVNITYI